MTITRSIEECRAWGRSRTGRLGFVPTMGALHKGHLSLMRQAKRECDAVAVSIFVNPLQFGPNEDLSRYPRQEEADIALCAEVGVDQVFIPFARELTESMLTHVHVKDVGDAWEGAHRPGHFDGVATIVLKLFNIVGPDVAYFGLKDLQQCAVIEQTVSDLAVPVDLEFVETVREPSGLAMSSRNAYLNPDQRKEAAVLHRELQSLASVVRLKNHWNTDAHDTILAKLSDVGMKPDYLAMVDRRTMQSQSVPDRYSRLIAAVRFHGVRLIDNVSVHLSDKS